MASQRYKSLFSYSWVLLAALACSSAPVGHRPLPDRPPNIVLVLADDLGWGDLRAYDPESVIPTPNIDRLAEQGMRFTDAHSPSSVCTPTRYGILTGRYAWRTRLRRRVLRYFDPPLIEASRLTLPGLLRGRGYATAAIGKWHLGLNVPATGGSGFARMNGRQMPYDPDFTAAIQGGPPDLGFDTYFGAQDSRVKAFVRDRHFLDTPVRGPAGTSFASPGWVESQKGPIQLSEAVGWIERLHTGDPNRPFFLYFASQSPHTPYSPPVSIAGMPVAGTSGAGARGDLVVELDVTLGQLVSRLNDFGMARNTLIILTSDNGAETRSRVVGEAYGHDPTGGWRGGKRSLWEAGHRVPFIARWGDGTAAGSVIPPGSVSHQLIGLQDLMATIADLMGEPMPPDAAEDSESFLPALLRRRGTEPIRRHIVHHSPRRQFAFRRGDWKLIYGDPTPPGDTTMRRPGSQLFNLAEDPREVTDVYRDHPKIVAQLSALLEDDYQSGHSAGRLE